TGTGCDPIHHRTGQLSVHLARSRTQSHRLPGDVDCSVCPLSARKPTGRSTTAAVERSPDLSPGLKSNQLTSIIIPIRAISLVFVSQIKRFAELSLNEV